MPGELLRCPTLTYPQILLARLWRSPGNTRQGIDFNRMYRCAPRRL